MEGALWVVVVSLFVGVPAGALGLLVSLLISPRIGRAFVVAAITATVAVGLLLFGVAFLQPR